MPSHALAIDAGTTGITAIVFDADRRAIARSYAEFTQHFPQAGWVEHDADEILRVAEQVGGDALREAGLNASDVVVGITNQRETTVIWDRDTGRPIHHAIVWQDRRTAKRCSELSEHADSVRAKTGLVIDPYFCATKIEWILDHVDGARSRAESGQLAFGTIDAWLANAWTGRHVTDVTNASRTLLFDIHADAWDAELLALFQVPPSLLPEVVPSSARIGTIAHGTLAGAELAGLVGDQQAALFGQGCHAAGQAKNTYGTGCFMLQHTGHQAVASTHGLLTTRAASIDTTPAYALEGSVFVGGAAIQWLRDGIKIIDTSPDVNDRASESDDNGGVVFVPAFTGLGAPYWDPNARGAIFGLTRGTTRRHIARAALESIALQSLDLLRAMEADAGPLAAALRVDGGASQSDLLMQMQADVMQRDVVRPPHIETTAWGAAWLAGIAVGLYTPEPVDVEITRFTPKASNDAADAMHARWQQAVAACQRFPAT